MTASIILSKTFYYFKPKYITVTNGISLISDPKSKYFRGAERKPVLLAHDVWHHMRGDWTTNQVDTADHCSQRIERPQAINICPSKQLSRSRRSSVKQEDNIGTECEGLR